MVLTKNGQGKGVSAYTVQKVVISVSECRQAVRGRIGLADLHDHRRRMVSDGMPGAIPGHSKRFWSAWRNQPRSYS